MGQKCKTNGARQNTVHFDINSDIVRTFHHVLHSSEGCLKVKFRFLRLRYSLVSVEVRHVVVMVKVWTGERMMSLGSLLILEVQVCLEYHRAS